MRILRFAGSIFLTSVILVLFGCSGGDSDSKDVENDPAIQAERQKYSDSTGPGAAGHGKSSGGPGAGGHGGR